MKIISFGNHLKAPAFLKKLPRKFKIGFSVSLAVLAVAGIFTQTPPGQALLASASKRQLPIYCVQKDSKVISLSFDAAWGNAKVRQSLIPQGIAALSSC